MHNHDSTQLTGARPRGRSAACRRVPSHAVPCGTPYAACLLGASLPAAERNASTTTATTTPTATSVQTGYIADRLDRAHR